MSSDWAAEQVSFLCRHCATHSLSEVIATELWIEREQDGTYRGGPKYRYRLVKCTACSNVSLLVAMKIGWDDESLSDIYEDESAVYPAPPRSLSAAIPKTLQHCFQEARACYQARAYTASAIMCRRALELLALERGIKERSLDRSLEKLKDQGHIDQRLFDWCDALRLAGNQAAHGMTSVRT